MPAPTLLELVGYVTIFLLLAYILRTIGSEFGPPPRR